MFTEKWDRRFLKLAEEIASFSKDPSTRVGCVIVDDDKNIISQSYNGLPPRIKDSEERLNDREVKIQICLHAEANALLRAEKSLENCHIYTWPFPPCAYCSSMIIVKKIKRIIAPNNYPERWHESMLLGKDICDEAGILTTLY